MLFYISTRLAQSVPVVFLLSLGSFLMLYMVPGDPARVMAGEHAPPQSVEAIREVLGLDKPLLAQLGGWYAGLAQGDLGHSYFLRRSVTQAIAERLEVTLLLATMAITIAVVVGIFLGSLAAIRQNTTLDRVVTTISVLGVSIPNFWFGLILIAVFAVELRWFPTGGYVPLSEDPFESMRRLVLPAITLSLPNTAYIARISRSSVVEVLRKDYIRTARSKGITEWATIYKHALKNAMIPVLTVIGIVFALLLSGAVVTETIFSLPGFGRLLIQAIERRDYPLIQGAMLFVGLIFIAVNLVVDLCYAMVDPRIRYT